MNGKGRRVFSEEGQRPEGDEGTGGFGRWQFPTEGTASAKALRQIGLEQNKQGEACEERRAEGRRAGKMGP